MSRRERLIIATIGSIYLATAAWLLHPEPSRHPSPSRAATSPSINGLLTHDQLALRHDMRKLRRELRSGGELAQVDQVRDDIRSDWLNIVTDRGYPTLPARDFATELARNARRPEDTGK